MPTSSSHFSLVVQPIWYLLWIITLIGTEAATAAGLEGAARAGIIFPIGRVLDNGPVSETIDHLDRLDANRSFRVVLKLKGEGEAVSWWIRLESGARSFTISEKTEVANDRSVLSPIIGAGSYNITSSHGAPRVQISYIISSESFSHPLSIVNTGDPTNRKPDFESVVKVLASTSLTEAQENKLRVVAAAMVRLSIEDKQNNIQLLCSGFVVASKLVMTNQHCAPDDDTGRFIIRGWLNGIRADLHGAPTHQRLEIVPLKFKKKQRGQRRADYALLHLSQPVAEVDPLLLASSFSGKTQDFLLTQYPRDLPLTLVRDKDCKFFQYFKYLTTREKTRQVLVHGCDTDKGSSGSPVLDREMKKVIGVHFWGHVNNQAQKNRAEIAARILAELHQFEPEIAEKIKSVP